MAQLQPISPAALDFLERPLPSSNSENGGTHRWLVSAGGRVKDALTPDQMHRFLTECCAQLAYRPVPDREIAAAVQFLYAERDPSKPRLHVPSLRPEQQPSVIDKVLQSGIVPLYDGISRCGMEPFDILAHLFDPGELICVGQRQADPGKIITQEELINTLERYSFIVPNPMRGAEKLLNAAGTPSLRCNANVLKRRYLVIEFDDVETSRAQQALLSSELARIFPLALAVFSGNHSIHAWYHVEDAEPGELDAFFSYACILGADPHSWTPCAWLRMPGGWRKAPDGVLAPKLQECLFFQPITRKGSK